MKLLEIIKSKIDDVQKFVFENSFNSISEVSLIRKGDGKDIICVPSQTNCKMGCKFCHLTGIDLPANNLKSEEIVLFVNEILEISPPQNDTLLISYMGAGEPILNVNEVIKSALEIKQNSKYNQTRFGLSTIIPRKNLFDILLRDVKEHNLNMKLHYSWHITNEESRKSLMPHALPINQALGLLYLYSALTKRPIEIHYTLMNDINDSIDDIKKIESLIDKCIPIKLLRFAPRNDETLMASKNVLEFKKALEERNFTVELYAPPGNDINAACGQFSLKEYSNARNY